MKEDYSQILCEMEEYGLKELWQKSNLEVGE